MKRILTKTAAALLVVGGLVVVLWPVPNWRLYDANWQPLAMTEAENYCAGKILAENGFANKQDDPNVDLCVQESDKGTEPKVGSSQVWFCEGITSVVPWDTCLDITHQYEVWGLQHGGFTFEWNTSNPYPNIIEYDISQAPRRAGREDETRNDTGRYGE